MFNTMRRFIEFFFKKKEKPADQIENILTAWGKRTRAILPAPPDSGEEWKRFQRTIAIQEDQRLRRRIVPWSLLRVPRVAGYLAAFTLLVGVGLYVYGRVTPANYSTGKKERMTAVLGDGSEARLNHSSTLTFRRGLFDNSRLATLKGEAFFFVRKNEAPFVITTAVGTVTVVGTEFNVKAKGERLEVAVNEGIVTLSSRVGSKDSTVRLAKGEISLCTAGGFPERPRRMRFGQYAGWVQGKLFFYQQTLKDICNEIEEMYDVTINLSDDSFASTTVTGVLEGKEPIQLLQTLCTLTGRQFKMEHDAFVIY